MGSDAMQLNFFLKHILIPYGIYWVKTSMTHCGHMGAFICATHLDHAHLLHGIKSSWIAYYNLTWHLMIVRMWDHKLYAMLATNALYIVHWSYEIYICWSLHSLIYAMVCYKMNEQCVHITHPMPTLGFFGGPFMLCVHYILNFKASTIGHKQK